MFNAGNSQVLCQFLIIMNWLIKTAQAKLEEGQDTRDGSSIYYVSGNTYPIRTQLKSLGFRWYRAKGFWWMPGHKIQSAMRGLQSLGVDTSVVEGNKSPIQPQDRPSEIPQPTIPKEVTESVIDNSPSDEPEDKIPFPIKNNIYSETVPVDILGQQIELTVQLNRKAKEGKGSSRYNKTYPLPWRKYPQYNVDIMFNEESLMKLALPINRENRDKTYFQINEDVDILPLFKDTVAKIPEALTNPKNRLRLRIEHSLHLSQRSPELNTLLENLRKYSDNHQEIKRNVFIDHPDFPNEYPIKIEVLGNSFYLYTALEHPSAPQPEMLTSVDLPDTVKTIDEFNDWLDQVIQDPNVSAKIQKRYIEYLNSFAFSEEEASQEKEQLSGIASMIQNKSMDYEFYRQKLIQLGYVRPHKRQKQHGPGMVPQDSIKWVIDTKKIIADGFYSRNDKFTHSPDFFYALIAYHMHRFKAGTTDHVGAIQSNLISFSHILKRYGFDINWRELADYTETIARQLVEEITGERAPNTAWDNYQQFYNEWGNWSGGERGPDSEWGGWSGDQGSLPEFVNMAVQLGADRQQALNNPKAVYRQLSMKYHPDLNPNVDPNIMARLNSAYDKVPQSLKAESENWLQKVAGI